MPELIALVIMVPDAASIARRRHLMRTIVRAVALTLLVLFLAPALVGLLGLGVALLGVDPGWGVGELLLFRLLPAAGFLVAAAGLLFFEKRLIAWLVPIPRSRCPQCEYFLVSLVELRCPECGLPLTPDFLDHPTEAGQGTSRGRHG